MNKNKIFAIFVMDRCNRICYNLGFDSVKTRNARALQLLAAGFMLSYFETKNPHIVNGAGVEL